MVDLIQQYDPDAEANGFDTLPDGTYAAQIVESDKVPISKDKDNGDCLSLCWKVTEGEFEGRLFWQRIMLWWTGAEKTPGKVVQIANGQFKDLRDATGVALPSASEELHFIPCLVTYGAQKDNPQYSEVKSVKPMGGAPTRQVASAQHRPAPAAANSGARSAPWPSRRAG